MPPVVQALDDDTKPTQISFGGLLAPEHRAHIWAIGGGKGGIGKSLLSSSLAISLAQRGRRVVLFDADLGGANLHTLLGISPPSRSISDFIERRAGELADVTVPTGIPNLLLISGASDSLESANLKYVQKVRLIRRLRGLGADDVVLDVGAGSGFNALDFFNLANIGILVALPEPTSIENGYRFLRGAALRRMRQVSTHDAYQKLLDRAQDQSADPALRHMGALAECAGQIEPRLGDGVRRAMEGFLPRLVLNQVRDAADLKIGHGLRSVCLKLLGIDIRFQGAIPYDDTVWQSIRKRKPHLISFPDSAAAKALHRLVDNLQNQSQLTMSF